MIDRNYDDMINMPCPTSPRHPRMPRADRAAQFAPFAALTGYDAAIDETGRLTDQKIDISEDMREKLFGEIEKYKDSIRIGFTCAKLDTLAMAAKRFPNADIHYDGGDLSAERLEEVKALAAGHHLYVWVCFDNDMTWWFNGTKATPEVCRFVRQYGELGVWILSRREELEVAIKELDAEIIETTGHIKPEWIAEINR